MTALPKLQPRTLIDVLLEQQQRLTAVERFARKHQRYEQPAQARYYADLIPLSKPDVGQQYAFAVDLDSCTGCKACVSACHSLNGLDDEEIWRDVGLLHGGRSNAPYLQTVTTACHHCVDPACLNGCPVRAYEKDSATGIVRHLDDQCIGCQYCVLKCPYDVPKYSRKRGIVRKCDMCHSRLAANEAPACVQACPTGAITIRLVDKADVAASIVRGERLLPGAFESEYTRPTTTYATRRHLPADTRPGDSNALRTEHAHLPLVFMLVLTQFAAGVFTALAVVWLTLPERFTAVAAPLSLAGFVILNAGLATSVLHLGRPLGAWRVFLGLRTSWMSREIFAFGALTAASAACTTAACWPNLAAAMRPVRAMETFLAPAALAGPLAAITAAIALCAVWCSAMIYIDTRRAFWRSRLTLPKFLGTTLLLGVCTSACVFACSDSIESGDWIKVTRTALAVSAVLQVGLAAWEARTFLRDLHRSVRANHRSALIIWRLQRPVLLARVAITIIALALTLLALGSNAALFATAALVAALGAQMLERYFFFTAVVAYRMPGPLNPRTGANP